MSRSFLTSFVELILRLQLFFVYFLLYQFFVYQFDKNYLYMHENVPEVHIITCFYNNSLILLKLLNIHLNCTEHVHIESDKYKW